MSHFNKEFKKEKKGVVDSLGVGDDVLDEGGVGGGLGKVHAYRGEADGVEANAGRVLRAVPQETHGRHVQGEGVQLLGWRGRRRQYTRLWKNKERLDVCLFVCVFVCGVS